MEKRYDYIQTIYLHQISIELLYIIDEGMNI